MRVPMGGAPGSARGLILAVGAAALLAASAYAAGRPEPALDRIRREGVVRIGYAPEAPFAFRDAGGRVTGESPEVARAVFARMGIHRVEWVQTEFRALIPELRAGRFDLIAAGMYITPERARQVAFTRPTVLAPTALLVRRADAGRLRSLADVRDADARLAVLAGAFEERLAHAAGIAPERLIRVPDPAMGEATVRTGRADAFALSHFTLRRMTDGRPSSPLVLVSPLPDTVPGMETAGRGAFAVRRGERGLRRAVDAALAEWIGTPDHLRLVAPFGVTAADLPEDGR